MRTTPQPEYFAYHLLYKIVCSIVEHPDQVSIQTISTVSDMTFSVNVAPEDTPRFRGISDKNLEAIQTLLDSLTLCGNRKFHVAARPDLTEPAMAQEQSDKDAVA